MSTSFSRFAIAVAGLALLAQAAHAATFHQQIAADPRGQVAISNIAGSIVVRGWDRPTVSVSADLRDASQRVLVKGGHGRTRVCVTNDAPSCNGRSGFGSAPPVRLVVQVPRDSELEASGVSAGIRSRGVAGTQHLHTVSGDIDAELGAGNDNVESVSGGIRLRGSGHEGTLHVASVSGNLSVTGVAGELEARTVDGTLHAQLSSARRVRLTTTSGNIELEAGLARGGSVATTTVSGDVRVAVSAAAGFSYEAKTFSGDLHDCFGQPVKRSESGPGSRLEGTRAAGDGHVRIKSLSGDISLCDH
jgi:hypothetical protein